jgi:hypothetical protein
MVLVAELEQEMELQKLQVVHLFQEIQRLVEME